MQHEESHHSHVATGGTLSIVSEFGRALQAAVLYPADHRRFAEIADGLIGSIQEVAEGATPFSLEVDEGGLTAMGGELPADAAGASELRELLVAIGVGRIEVDASARRRDLHALLGRLALAKRRVDSVGEVRDLDYDDLPASVRARRRESGRRLNVTERGPGGGARVGQGPTIVPGLPSSGPPPSLRLDDHGGASRPRILRREEMPDSKPAQAARGEGGDGPKLILHGKANGRASADAPESGADEERAVGPVAGSAPVATSKADEERRALLSALSEGASLLDALFGTGARGKDAASRDAGADDAQAQGSEDEASARAAQDAGQPERKEPQAERLSLERDGCELSIQDLRSCIESNAQDAEPLSRQDVSGHTEELSILLQLLANTSDPARRRGIGAELDRLLSELAVGSERAIVHAALHDLVLARDPAQVDANLPLVLAPLRRARVESIGGLLLELLREGPAESVGLLWPHVANELLLGVKHEDPEVAQAMLELVGRIPAQILRSGLGRVAALEALSSGRVTEELLEQPSRELARLLAELLEAGECEELGGALLKSYKARPPVRAAEIALAGFTSCVPSCRRLLVALLRDVGRGRQTRAVNEIAGRILVEGLERLAPHQREHASVVEAILALGGMRHRPALSILNQIVREKRAVLVPAWPAVCREAAQRALRTLGAD